ncbi:MAG TPA: protease inhibitor I42 family protein [Pyrinomonadaceae bacterium]|nr:protease inhibitor I42 family protein [Pyrinomonadaceae bacterium]
MPKVYRGAEREIDASVGESFVIELEGNATTGYEWKLEFDESKVKLIGDEYVPAGASGIGSGGHHRFTLQPVVSGQVSILARYKRAWEPEHLEQKEISLRIKK